MRRAQLGAWLLLVACLNPDDILPVTGRLASVDSVEGQAVRLLRQPRLPTFGVCDGSGLAAFKQTIADADGGYGFEVFRAQAQNLGDQASYCFRIDTAFASGGLAWSDVQIATLTRVAPLRDWRPEPRLESGALQLSPPIPLPELDPSATQVPMLEQQALLVTADGGVVWKASDWAQSDPALGPARQPIQVDELRLEDFSGALTLRAHLQEYLEPDTLLGGTGTWSATDLRSGQQLAFSGSRIPLSRGWPCPEVATPCPLTDGDLAAVDLGQAPSVSLDLPAATALSWLVLRGVETTSPTVAVQLTLEDGGLSEPLLSMLPISGFEEATGGSGQLLEDGGWVQPTLPPAYAVIALDAGAPVRRVSVHFPGSLSRIQELSLF
jgi:hypothetical protein